MFLSLSLESHSLRKPLSKHKKKFFLIFDQEISFNNIITLTKQYHAFQKSYLTKMHLPNICYLDHDTGGGVISNKLPPLSISLSTLPPPPQVEGSACFSYFQVESENNKNNESILFLKNTFY